MDQVIINEATKRFGGDPSTLTLLGGFSQNVFETDYRGKKAVLKIIPGGKQEEQLLMAEIDYMGYLRRNGIGTVELLPSLEKKHIETIEFNGKPYLAMVFEKAVGKFINEKDPEEWNGHLFEKWGACIGKMHHLTKDYSYEHLPLKRPEWNEEAIFREIPLILDPLVLNKWKEYIGVLNTLPRDKDSYGLIHYDLHQKNFLIDTNGDMTIIDFGDCEYSWYLYDLVIAAYHSMDYMKQEDRESFFPFFIDFFLKGYLQENKLDEYWISKIPFFLKFRRLYSYIYIHRFIDQSNLSEGQRHFLEKMKKNILQDSDIVRNYGEAFSI